MQLVKVQKIWEQAPHNAFTDLIWFQQAFWCVFREGLAHISADGAFRLLRSENGIDWENIALLTHPAADLRDAKLSITPAGKLLLLGAGALHNRTTQSYQSYIWQSDDGYQWSAAIPCGEANIWLWRLSWHSNNTAYTVGYKCGAPHFVRLYQSQDGQHFQPITDIYQGSYANESGLVFDNNHTAYCLLRRDPEQGLFGTAQPPYTHWQWHETGHRIGGPQLIQLPDQRLLACVRLYDNCVRTSLCLLDQHSGRLTEQLALPSGGDCSYAGMVVRNNRLFISYYSSHEGKTAIYLAEVAVNPNT